MPYHDIKLAAVGNALVDIISNADDVFLKSYGMNKGSMMLIDEQRVDNLDASIVGATMQSGGSAANTMAGFASFGGKGAFIGKVANDELGRTFSNDLKSQGILYSTEPLEGEYRTGRCIIYVTPDGERTMNTYLGASVEISASDVNADIISAADVTFLEGYLFDRDQAKTAFLKAADICRNAGKKLALTLSDPFCVDRHRSDFLNLVENHVDILIANQKEIISLYQTEDFDTAKDKIKGRVDIAALTRSEKGSCIVTKDREILIDPISTQVVDTTGAGDQFAAGFLYGFTHGYDLETSGKLGTMAATDVISHYGARPEIEYATFLPGLAKAV